MPEICQDLEPQNSLRLHSGQLSFALDVHFPCDTRNGACWLILLLGFRYLFFFFLLSLLPALRLIKVCCRRNGQIYQYDRDSDQASE